MSAGAALARPRRHELMPLGVGGGPSSSGGLSAYLVTFDGGQSYVGLDAGTLLETIQSKALLNERLKAVAISHPHLDHVASLAIDSTAIDSSLPVIGWNETLLALRKHLFNFQLWPDMFALGKLAALPIRAGQMIAVPGVDGLNVTAFPLSHSGMLSTAFLLTPADGKAVLYLGDTGADEVEGSSNLRALWKAVAPLISHRRLGAILVECSFADPYPEALLYGHLTPQHLMKELGVLYSMTENLSEVKFIITHIKSYVTKDARHSIEMQLNDPMLNVFGLHFILAERGVSIGLE